MARDADMMGYAGSRVYTLVDSSGPNNPATANKFSLGVKNALVAAGWTMLSDTIDGGGRHVYVMLSQQSPWWSDEASPPPSYIGKIELTITANDNLNVHFQGRDASHNFGLLPSGTTLFIPLGLADPYIVVSTKFSVYIQRPGSGAGANLMAGVMNSPRFLQDGGLVDNWYCFECQAFRSGLQLASGAGGWHYQDSLVTSRIDNASGGSAVSGGRAFIKSLWSNILTTAASGGTCIGFPNLATDPTLADPTKWIPNLSPAEFHIVTVASIGNPLARGWFWDMVILGMANSVVAGRVTLPTGHVVQAITTAGGNNAASLYVCVAGTDQP